MKILQQLKSTPLILKPKKHILLLSHMRAYTSLLGHIIGSHSEIEGYYEMHTGYHSWKSCYKVKNMYYLEHQAKKNARFLFDKVLHNDHNVSAQLLSTSNFYPIISIRSPEKTIQSIIAHYNKVNPSHEYNNLDFASNYYKERLLGLANIAKKITGQYLFFDAEAIKTNTDNTLTEMSSFLGLHSQLTPEYNKMEKTGTRFSGDNSSELFSGTIQVKDKVRDDTIKKLIITDDIIELYQQIRHELTHNAQVYVEK